MCYLDFGSEFAFGYILKCYKLCFWDAGFSNQEFKASLHQELSITGQESEHSGGKSLASSPKAQPNKWNTDFSPVSSGTVRSESSP